ncbi:MAG: M28 family peptidase, partial [Dehalococcoidia bacterium]|nr:M28 family peptidase [Dehalococcoidia bacterium]
AGTPQEKQAADLIATDLQRFGYQVQQQPFDVLPSFGPGILSVQTPSERAVDAAPLRQTGLATSAGDLVDGGLGRPEDFPKEGIKGKIALMERGQIFFEVKVLNAVAAGAAGAIIYNNESGPFSGTLGTQAAIPVVGIARGERLVLKRLLADGRVSVKLTIAVSRSQNMVAILNPGRPQAVIMGGHYDTVPQTGGANDNSSGTAAILVIAQEAAQRGYPFELRVIAFGAEELGLLRRAQEVAQAKNVAIGLSRLQGGSSDHASFLAVEIPAVFFSAGDLSRIHTAADTIANLDPPRLGEAVTMGLGMLDSLAR